MRLHELAKEMEVEAKEILALAKKLGLTVKSHSTNLAPGEVGLLKVGYRFRDLDEEEIYERLEQEQNRKIEENKVEKEVHHARHMAQMEEERREKAAAEKKAAPETERAEPVSAQAAGAATEPQELEEVVEPEVEVEEALAGAASASVATPEGQVEGLTTAAPKEGVQPAEVKRRGAKILGRIELAGPAAAPAATGKVVDEEAVPGGKDLAGARGAKEAAEKEKQRKKLKSSSVKWSLDPEEYLPIQTSAIAVTRPKFWERVPQRRARSRPSKGGARQMPRKNVRAGSETVVVVPISVKEYSQQMGIRTNEILAKLLLQHEKVFTANSMLGEEDVLQLSTNSGRDVQILRKEDVEQKFLRMETEKSTASPKKEGVIRPPVVTFMGHVDHGKTSLLDAIRKTRVVDSEHGGITQHIRAYSIKTKDGHAVTFLDTPGHRAFTELRARGANCTDIVVLVVAADDGVMPQTVEALEHARAASEEMPIVIALNKVDKSEANVMRAKQQLMAHNLLPEEYGGKVGVIETSATTGRGIDDLIERLVLEAEIHDLRAEPKNNARGVVIEASKQEGKGVFATILVRDGTLRVRDPFLCGSTWGRVRSMEDDQGQPVKEAGPSMPVRVFGFKGDVPGAGEQFMAVEDERGAEQVASDRARKLREGELVPREQVTLDNLFASLSAGKVEEIKVVVKADVQGSVEVLKRELSTLSHEEVKVRVLRAAVGGISEEDVMLASTTQGIVVGFGVVPDSKARRLQDQLGVEIRTYNIIYELLDDLKKAMAGALRPEEKEKIVGHVEVRRIFKISRMGTIAGCRVIDGVIRRTDRVRVIRDGKVIYTTTLDSLKRFKEDVREVKEGFECGLKLASFDDVKVGDQVESFEIVLLERELSIA